MLNFASDYTEGCHPKVLEALTRTNMEQLTGYGTDIYSDRAKEKIRAFIGHPEAKIFFLTGGTQHFIRQKIYFRLTIYFRLMQTRSP